MGQCGDGPDAVWKRESATVHLPLIAIQNYQNREVPGTWITREIWSQATRDLHGMLCAAVMESEDRGSLRGTEGIAKPVCYAVVLVTESGFRGQIWIKDCSSQKAVLAASAFQSLMNALFLWDDQMNSQPQQCSAKEREIGLILDIVDSLWFAWFRTNMYQLKL